MLRRKGQMVANHGAVRLVLPDAAAHPSSPDLPGLAEQPAQSSAPPRAGEEGPPAAAAVGGPVLELLRSGERLLVVSVHLRTGALLLALGGAQDAEVGADMATALRKARARVSQHACRRPAGFLVRRAMQAFGLQIPIRNS